MDGVAKFIVHRTPTGHYTFSLVVGDGQVIATGRSYDSKAPAINAIKSVKGNAPDATIEDRTQQIA